MPPNKTDSTKDGETEPCRGDRLQGPEDEGQLGHHDPARRDGSAPGLRCDGL